MSRTAFAAALGIALSVFVCHKTVQAAPIVSFSNISNTVSFTAPDGETKTVGVPVNFFARGTPEPGDYLVIYEPDGYMSWSPKAVFEAGYHAAPAEAKPETVTAKLRCHYIQKSETCHTVHLHPVYSADPASENAKWSKATPSGSVSLSITNPAAYGRFEEGTEYLLTFSPVDSPT